LPVADDEGRVGDRFTFVGDRWNEWNLSDWGYVWLPLSFDEESGHPIVTWNDEWSPATWPT